jgi:predicted nucleotidyltransferase
VLQAEPNFLDILRILTKHEVKFIVVGGVSAVLQGAPLMTFDVDVVHSRDPQNIDRLLAALTSLDAFYRLGAARRLRPGPSHLSSPGHQLLATQLGPLDLLGTVGEDRDYNSLLPHTLEVELEEVRVRVLNLETLIQLKEQAGRDKDLAVLPVLRQTLEQSRE